MKPSGRLPRTLFLPVCAISLVAAGIVPVGEVRAVAPPGVESTPSPSPGPGGPPGPSVSPGPSSSPFPSASPTPTPSPSGGPVATTTTLTASVTAMITGDTVTFTATVAPSPGGGTVVFTDDFILDSDPGLHVIGQAAVDPVTGAATMSLTATSGLWGVVATFSGFGGYLGSRSARLVIPAMERGASTSTAFVLMESSVEANVAVTVTATVTPPAAGTVVFTSTSDEVGSAQVDASTGVATARLRFGSPGDMRVRATFLGASGFAGSQSIEVPVVVTPDAAVHPVDAGVSSGVFYPVKDGYRDTVDVTGVLLDPARVSVAIYAGSKRVRKVDIGAKVDDYAWTWNGRDDRGKLLPAGRYRVVQSFRDAAGHTATYSSVTTVSLKKLVWKKGVVTRNGVDADGWDASAFAWVSGAYSGFAHGVDLYGNVYDSWAWVGYRFTLRAAVRYGTVTWAVRGHNPPHAINTGPAHLSLWDWTLGDEGDLYETDTFYGWYWMTLDADAYVSEDRKVQAYVSVFGADRGHFDVETVRLTYTYAVLE